MLQYKLHIHEYVGITKWTSWLKNDTEFGSQVQKKSRKGWIWSSILVWYYQGTNANKIIRTLCSVFSHEILKINIICAINVMNRGK